MAKTEATRSRAMSLAVKKMLACASPVVYWARARTVPPRMVKGSMVSASDWLVAEPVNEVSIGLRGWSL